MKNQLILLGSASLLMTATGAQAADPVLAIEPAAKNQVEACDVFGKGFFYIPGTQTCLQVGGYVRFEIDDGGIETGGARDDDWGTMTRTVLGIVAKSDTEFGTLTTLMAPKLEHHSDGTDTATLDNAYINLGDEFFIRAGYFKSYWDQDLWGELDNIDNVTQYNSIRLGMYVDNFEAAVQIDALSPSESGSGGYMPSSTKLGYSLRLGYVVAKGMEFKDGLYIKDGTYFKLDAAYDSYNENYAIRPWAGFGLFGGTFEIAGLYESGFISYAPDFTASNWDDSPIAGTYMKYAVAANYYFNVTDNFVVAPQTQYNVASNDKVFWEAGVTTDWEAVKNMHVRLNLNYAFLDDDWNQQNWFGWLRFERDF